MCPKQEQLQPAQATDGTETNRTKSNKHLILPSIFGIVSPPTLSDVSQPSGITWKGRKGWLKEYVQIAIRRVQENGGQEDGRSSGVNDVSPAGGESRAQSIWSRVISDKIN